MHYCGCKTFLNDSFVEYLLPKHFWKIWTLMAMVLKYFLSACIDDCKENHISFSRRPERMVFRKKLDWNMIFLVLFGKIMFIFLENMILTFDRKWKVIFFKKIQRNIVFSSGLPQRRSFQKGPRRDVIFLVLSGKIVFFFRKTWYFFLGQEASDDLPQEIHGNMIFSVYRYGCYKPGVKAPCQKIKEGPIPQKYTYRWLSSRLTSWKELQQFHVRAFSCIALQRKIQET